MNGWKRIQSAKGIKPDGEGWFIAWEKGNLSIEIIRVFDDDRNKQGDFEVSFDYFNI